jgi:hypothetical protein
MVEKQPRLEIKTQWLPTRASGERSFLMGLEFSLNHIPKGDELSIAEVACSTGKIDQALAILPPIIPKPTRRKMRRLLQPWPDGRYTAYTAYTAAYRRSGGILNLFTPPWGEQEDEVWAEILAQRGAESMAELEQRWNRTPHPFFAGLTPAQVMVGGGPQEAELAGEFRERLTQTFDGHPFESEGESLVKTLLLLRGWQCQPRPDGRTPPEIILAERDELLARRARFLAERATPR